MNKIKNYLCAADPFDIMAIIIIIVVFLGLGYYTGPVRFFTTIGIGAAGIGTIILIGFVIYKSISKLQERCKNVQS